MKTQTRFRVLLPILSIGFAAGCFDNRYQTTFTPASFNYSYPPVVSTKIINVGHEDPMVIRNRDFASAELVGTSLWIGNEAFGDNCKAWAMKVGADLVLWESHPYSSGTIHTTMLVPDNQTTYYSGSVSNPYSGVSNYSGTSTSYGTQTVPMDIPFVWYEFKTVYLRTSEAATHSQP